MCFSSTIVGICGVRLVFSSRRNALKNKPVIICAVYLERMPQFHCQGSGHPHYLTSARLARLMWSRIHHDGVSLPALRRLVWTFCGVAGKSASVGGDTRESAAISLNFSFAWRCFQVTPPGAAEAGRFCTLASDTDLWFVYHVPRFSSASRHIQRGAF